MISRNDLCWCGSQKKWKKCHYPKLPSLTQRSLAQRYREDYGILLKTPEQLDKIRAACQVTSRILDELCKKATAGVTTEELDQLSRKLHREFGVIPAPLHYGEPPFPKTICTSLNEVICHGIPGPRKLIDGDILNIDVSCILNGYFGDCSRMVAIGTVSPEKQLVIDVSLECLHRAIAVCKPGIPIWHIGRAIEDYATTQSCSVVNEFVGHGVGIAFHEAPEIPHHYNEINIELVPGMTFTIEPMINAGVRKAIIDANDHWTARTEDGRPSAQWEHTLAITEDGCEILTLIK
jgi:methionyl aminopeptidase